MSNFIITRIVGLMLTVAMVATAGEPASSPAPLSAVYEQPEPPVPVGEIDQLVFAQLAALHIQPVLCSDAVFVRRVFLDVLGKLPSAREAREFIQDPDPDHHHKRQALIDRLLARPEFADYWAMKWGDVLRIKAEFPINLWPNAAQAYHRWLRRSLAENKPYDQFARELLTSSGSNFRVGQVNFFRAVQNRTPEGIAAAVALSFMGCRVEAWPTQRLADLSVFFSQLGYKPTGEWKEEHVYWDPLGWSATAGNAAPGRPSVGLIEKQAEAPATNILGARAASAPRLARFPDGTTAVLPQDRDPRDVFADWLITPKNPWFTRSIANRVWAWLVGRGVVHEPDDLREGNPPCNPALLACLEKELIAGRYDLRRFYRLILTSQTYQLSSIARQASPEAEANFAFYPLRRLDAEVLIDAINQITGTSDLYTSPIPEPFTYIPEDQPAVALPDGSITSAFLALFGRSARATGQASERNNKPTSAQWLHLLNSTHIQRKIEQGPALNAVFESRGGFAEAVNELYLTILSRLPTPDEVTALSGYGQARPGASQAKKKREDWVDIAWALMNSAEFLYRH